MAMRERDPSPEFFELTSTVYRIAREIGMSAVSIAEYSDETVGGFTERESQADIARLMRKQRATSPNEPYLYRTKISRHYTTKSEIEMIIDWHGEQAIEPDGMVGLVDINAHRGLQRANLHLNLYPSSAEVEHYTSRKDFELGLRLGELLPPLKAGNHPEQYLPLAEGLQRVSRFILELPEME